VKTSEWINKMSEVLTTKVALAFVFQIVPFQVFEESPNETHLDEIRQWIPGGSSCPGRGGQ
jgi:hypothetical protein